MTSLRKLALSALLTVSAFSAVTMTSCKKDDSGCDVGYEGSGCKTLSRDKFIGQWKGTEACTTGSDNYSITLTASSTNEITIVYSNVYNANYTATGTMTGTNGFSFSGTGAASGGGTATFSGTATLDQSTGILTVSYSIESPAANNTCTFTGTKL